MLLFPAYELPEGREPGHPEVRVRKSTAEAYGIPEVDYDNLARFFRDELGIDSDALPIISVFSKFYDPESQISFQALHEGIDEYSYRTGRVIHVNGDNRKDTEKPLKEIDNAHVMGSVMMQAAALAAKRRRDGVTIRNIIRGEIVPVGAMAGGYGVFGDPGFLFAGFAASGYEGLRLFRRHAQLLKTRADEDLYELNTFHNNDIYWPSHYDRTHSEQDS